MILRNTLTVLCLCISFAPLLLALSFSAPLTDTYVVLGNPLWWTCSVVRTPQTPALTFIWRFQNGDIRNDQTRTAYGNGTLYFRGVQNSELGQYSCIVGDSVNIIQSSAWLRAAYVNASSVSLQPTQQLVLTGGVTVLDCKVDAKPAPVSLWLKDGNAIEKTTRIEITEVAVGHSMLKISNTSYSDAGSYTCRVSHISLTQPLTSPAAVVTVNGPPRLILRPQSQAVPIGLDVTFHCQVMSEPISQVVWSVQQLGSSVSSSLSPMRTDVSINALNGSLLLMDVDETDSGDYICTWLNQYGSATSQATLKVQGQPQLPIFIEIPSDTSLEEGTTLVLKCSGNGNPIPSVQWTHPNGAVLSKTIFGQADSSSNVQLQGRWIIDDNGTLTLQNINRIDAGFYYCQLVNTIGLIESRVFVNVLFKPYFTVAPQSTAVNTGSDFTLSCEATGNPKPTISWSVPFNPDLNLNATNAGLNSGKNEIVLDNGSLRVLSASVIHNGVFACVVSNQVGSTTASVAVTVAGIPYFAVKPMSQGVVEGDRVVLTYRVDSFPPATVVWYTKYMVDPGIQSTDIAQLKNSLSHGASLPTENMTLVQPGPNNRYKFTNGTSLEITNVTEPYAGLYICMATNDRGYVFEPAILRVITFPRFQQIPNDQKVSIGSEVILHCYSVGIPVPTQRWLFNFGKMYPNTRMTVFENGSLLIQNVEKTDFGSYTCLATNQAGQRSASAQLILSNLPYFLTQPTNITAVLGSNATLICRGKSSSTMEILWYLSNKEGKDVRLIGQTVVNTEEEEKASSNIQKDTGSKYQISREGDLYLDCIEESDAGWYKCSLQNSDGKTDSHPAFLTANYAPIDMNMGFPEKVYQSQAIVLSCEARGSPAPVISWVTPLKEELTGDGDVDTSIRSDQTSNIVISSLTIRSVQNRLHGGMWACKACNPVGCSLQRETLLIEGGPVVREINAEELNLEYKISCITAGSPSPDVRYSTNNVLIQDSTVGHRLVGNDLYVEKDQLNTEYSCTASNAFGSVTHNFFNPSSIRIDNLTPTSTSVALSMSSTFPIPHLLANKVVLQYKPEDSNVWQTKSLFFPSSVDDYFESEQGAKLNATLVSCENRDSSINQPVQSAALVSAQRTEVSIKSDGSQYEYSIKSVLEDLTPSTRYDIKAALSNILGEGPYSLPVQVLTLTAPPTSVTEPVVSVINRTALVTWTNPDPLNGRPEDTSITIVLLDSDLKPIEEAVISVMDPSTKSFPNLELGEYTIEIYASNTATNTRSDSTFTPFQIEDEPPQFVPRIDVIQAVDAYTLKINWTVPLKPDELIPKITGYIISITRTDVEASEKIFEINDSASSVMTIDKLQERTKYSIRIASRNSKGTGPYSAPESTMTPYSAFSELALENTDPGHNISWRLLAIILIVICSALILLTAIVVLSHQMKLAKSKSVDLTPHPDYPYNYNDVTSVENENQRNDSYQNEGYHNDTIQSARHHNDTIQNARYHNDTIQNARYHNDTIQNARYHNDTMQHDAYQNDSFENDRHHNDTIQNEDYQTNTFQSERHHGNTFDSKRNDDFILY